MTNKAKTWLVLFASSLAISAVTFGGGYVIVSVFKKRFVDELKWIDEDEMVDLIALAQSSPGVITVNAALLVGYRVCGPIGAFLAVIGVALPPLITISIISLFYNAFRENALVGAVLKGMQAGACAVISNVAFQLFTNEIKGKQVLLKAAVMAGAFVATYLLKMNVILVILFCALLGVILYFVNKEGKER
ncbi:MAG: chromate transporter [Clostridia bacterium]|nr:chromate transporter [Clostridia bacterium]